MTRLKQLLELYPRPARATMPLGVRVDDALFASTTAADPLTGVADGDLEAQLKSAIASLEHLLLRGGMGWINVERVEAYVAGGSTDELAELLQQHLGPITRIPRFFAQTAVLRAGQRLRLDIIATAGGERPEVRHLRLAANAAPSAVRIGPLLFAFDVTPVDPATSRIESADTAAQVAAAFENLDRVLEAASMDRDQLLRIGGYFRDLGEKDLLNSRMVTLFPKASEKPVHKYVPSALPPGVSFSLQALGLMADDRRIIEMEGVRHNDPISLGAMAGNVFVSSRVQARLEPTAREQARRLLDQHVRKLVEHVGGGLEDVTQTSWGIGDPGFAADVAQEVAAVWPEGRAPDTQIVEADFPHSPLPRVEFTAVLRS